MTAQTLNAIDCLPPRGERSLPIPSVFCWTKMGSESGQGLDAILKRKELERQSGGGLFSWGIGNSVGPALDYARQAAGWRSLSAVFTTMKSAPKSIDVSPDALVIWLSFVCEDGAASRLPEHMLVTSRAHGPSGAMKRSHYALMCRRSNPIKPLDESPHLDGSCARNLVTNGRVGFSQVTSVVRYDPELAEPSSAAYPVVFDAGLAGQWFVRLADPVFIDGNLSRLYKDACASQCPSDWLYAVKNLKAYAAALMKSGHPMQRSLFPAP